MSAAPRRSDPSGTGTTARRELTGIFVAAVLGAGLVLFVSGQEWATITALRRPPLPPVSTVALGSELAPLAPAAALVSLTATGALLAVRGVGRVLVGVLMVVASAAVVWSSGRVLGGVDVVTTQLQALGVPAADLDVDVAPAWPGLAVVGGALGVLSGLATAVRGRRWPAMGSRYERETTAGGRAPAPARPRTDEDRAQLAWNALDRGEDPTEPPVDRGV